MGESPTIETRIDQPYAAIPVSGEHGGAGYSVDPPLTGRVFGWLAGRGISPAGPPFWRYVVVDMEAKLELETGVPVASAGRQVMIRFALAFCRPAAMPRSCTPVIRTPW